MGFLQNLDLILAAVCIIGSVGCGNVPQQVPTADSPNAPTKTPPADAGHDTTDPTDTTTDTTTTVSLTVYSLTKTIASWTILGVPHTLQGTGSCVVYSGKNFCWDDGMKVDDSVEAQYWGMDDSVAVCPNFFGQCQSDLFDQVTLMSSGIVSKLDTVIGSAHRGVAEVLASSDTAVISCTDNGAGLLDCGSFTIDTEQSPL